MRLVFIFGLLVFLNACATAPMNMCRDACTASSMEYFEFEGVKCRCQKKSCEKEPVPLQTPSGIVNLENGKQVISTAK